MLRTAVQSPIVVALVAMTCSVVIYAATTLFTGAFTWLYTLVVCGELSPLAHDQRALYLSFSTGAVVSMPRRGGSTLVCARPAFPIPHVVAQRYSRRRDGSHCEPSEKPDDTFVTTRRDRRDSMQWS